MNVYLLLIIIVCIITNIWTFLLYRQQRGYTKQLFIRALHLECKLIDIYRHSSEEIKREIDTILSNIKPL